ncbi:MAG: FadR family transcriptional regulator [Oscillospiraceae bacterium]|nr:FadR family transcriptional regulator [Oscillospiraceae bacterium]
MKESSLYSQIGGESVVQQVMNKITDAIASGDLKPGDRLPPELELISAMHVSRNTLRAAIQTLRAYGVLEVRRPEGTFVCESFTPQLLNPMIYRIILASQESDQELIGLRKIMDMGISKLVIQQGLSEQRTAELEALYEDLKKKLQAEKPDIEAISEADLRFHDGVAKATHNNLAVTFNDLLLNLTSESRSRTIRRIFANNDAEYLVRVHRMHLDALEQKPGSDIDQALDYSYLYWKDSFDLSK